MWAVLLFQTAAFTFILIYWFSKPTEEIKKKNPPEETPSSDQPESAKTSKFNSFKKRSPLLRRRKALLEQRLAIMYGTSKDKAFEAFLDKYNSFEKISSALVAAGVRSCDVVIGIDFSASNEFQGQRTFSKNCLHKLNGTRVYNPYQKVLQILGQTLSFVSAERVIQAYGFGDETTRDKSVFPLGKNNGCFANYTAVIDAYTHAVRHIKLSGPTNLAPVINKAIEACQRTKQYHILLIVVDGQVSAQCESETVTAIVKASDYPLSIIAIGIGDGPFGSMFEYDDGLPKRKFDNFQFVNFHRTVTKTNHEAAFALHALMEIPDQYNAICQLGYIDSTYQMSENRKLIDP